MEYAFAGHKVLDGHLKNYGELHQLQLLLIYLEEEQLITGANILIHLGLHIIGDSILTHRRLHITGANIPVLQLLLMTYRPHHNQMASKLIQQEQLIIGANILVPKLMNLKLHLTGAIYTSTKPSTDQIGSETIRKLL